MGTRSGGPRDSVESRVLRASTELDPFPDTMGQALGDEARDAAVQLNGIVPDKVMWQNFLSGRPQGRHDPAPALTVGPCPRLDGASGAVPHGASVGNPAAVFPDRTGAARGCSGHAHQRSQLHRRLRPSRALCVVLGKPRGGSGALGRVLGGGGPGLTVGQAGKDPANIGVQHQRAPPESESQDRCCGVAAHTWQLQQLLFGFRHFVPTRCQLPRGFEQTQGTARISEPSPRSQHLTGPGTSQIRRGGPTFHPALPGPHHPGNRGLLAHHLTHQHTPSVHAGSAPRQWSCVRGVPVRNQTADGLLERDIGGCGCCGSPPALPSSHINHYPSCCSSLLDG